MFSLLKDFINKLINWIYPNVKKDYYIESTDYYIDPLLRIDPLL